MKKKQWLALGLAALVVVLQFVVPLAKPMEENTQELVGQYFGHGILNLNEDGFNKVTSSQAGSDKIAIITLEGTITSATNGKFNYKSLLKQLEDVHDDLSVKGLLFVVNTPGGGVFESAEIARRIRALKENRQMPIYVSMQNLAASGGYYVSALADKIYATEETWTGSIGVIIQKMNVSGLFEKYGIEAKTITSGKNKDMGSMFRKWNNEERDILQSLVDDAYSRFVDLVAEGRKLPKDVVKKIADGRIYTANQALENHLVDAIGWKEDALKALQDDNGLAEASIVEYKSVNQPNLASLFSSINSRIRGKANPDLEVFERIFSQYAEPNTPMYLYGQY